MPGRVAPVRVYFAHMRHVITLGAVAACVATGCKTDNAKPDNPVAWTVSAPAQKLTAGRAVSVQLAGKIDKGWYIYSLTQKAGGPTPMTVTVAPTPPFHVEGDVAGPKPVVVYDKEFGIDTERYQDAPTFNVPVAVASLPTTPANELQMKVRFQACNESLCLPARTVSLRTPVRFASR